MKFSSILGLTLYGVICLVLGFWIGYMDGAKDLAAQLDKQRPAPATNVSSETPVTYEPDPLTALVVSQSKEIGPFTVHKGQERAFIASFMVETNPARGTSVDMGALMVQVEKDTGLVLRNLELEFDTYRYSINPPATTDGNTWAFWRPVQYTQRYGPGMKLYANLYATIDKSSKEGAYTIPLRLTDWKAQNKGQTVPFPGVVNGQPLVVLP